MRFAYADPPYWKSCRLYGLCRFIADLLGYQDGDELIDLFPGSGVMGRTLAQGVLL